MKRDRTPLCSTGSLAVALLFTACAAPRSGKTGWEAIVCHEARGAIERVRACRPDPADPRLQAVCVDQAGDVALIHFDGDKPRSEVLHRQGVELTGLAVGDVDPSIPGHEIYVGGYARGPHGEEDGGVVLQIVVTANPNARARVRTLYTGPAYVHSIEIVPPQSAGTGAALLVSTYLGEVHLLTPTVDASAWGDRLLHREPPSADLESLKVKDAAFLVDPGGRAPHEAFLALKTGRLLFLDLDHPEATRLIHEEPGGLSRITADPAGGAYVTGYFGRLMHFVRDADGFRFEVLDQEGADSGLRGAVLGDFPADGKRAQLAIFGFHKLVRALVPRLGRLDPVTLYVDIDRGHTIEAGDFVPGNSADEILVGGYSKRITMLVAR